VEEQEFWLVYMYRKGNKREMRVKRKGKKLSDCSPFNNIQL